MASGIAVGGGLTPLAPESLVMGTGSYTVPAGKFGYISMSVSSSKAYSWAALNVGGQGNGGASANNNGQWIIAGTNITTSAANVSLDAVSACSASSSYSTANVNGGSTVVSLPVSASTQSWSLCIFSV